MFWPRSCCAFSSLAHLMEETRARADMRSRRESRRLRDSARPFGALARHVSPLGGRGAPSRHTSEVTYHPPARAALQRLHFGFRIDGLPELSPQTHRVRVTRRPDQRVGPLWAKRARMGRYARVHDGSHAAQCSLKSLTRHTLLLYDDTGRHLVVIIDRCFESRWGYQNSLRA